MPILGMPFNSFSISTKFTKCELLLKNINAGFGNKAVKKFLNYILKQTLFMHKSDFLELIKHALQGFTL